MNRDGTGLGDWEAFDLPTEHNRLVDDPSLKFCAEFENATAALGWEQSSAYGGLRRRVKTGRVDAAATVASRRLREISAWHPAGGAATCLRNIHVAPRGGAATCLQNNHVAAAASLRQSRDATGRGYDEEHRRSRVDHVSGRSASRRRREPVSGTRASPRSTTTRAWSATTARARRPAGPLRRRLAATRTGASSSACGSPSRVRTASLSSRVNARSRATRAARGIAALASRASAQLLGGGSVVLDVLTASTTRGANQSHKLLIHTMGIQRATRGA